MVCPHCKAEHALQGGRCSRCNACLQASDDPLVGTSLGKYTLLRRVAHGGQCAIYEASSDAGRVAIKLLSAFTGNTADACERLRREALAIQRLEHPNIVQLLEFGEGPNGQPWFAMEFLEGETLAQYIERCGTLPEQEVRSILRPLCEALAEAHQQGIVHRDLKPQNIMLVERGGERVPKILDFGIASLAGHETLTNSTTLKGTPMYMAPEQWEGLKHADPRTDVYALGVIAYEALSGKHAFEADTPLAWMKKAQIEAPIDLSIAAPGRWISPSMRAAVMRSLAKSPADRPQTPLAFLSSLDAPPAEVARVSRPSALWLLAVLLAALAGLFLGRRIPFEAIESALQLGPSTVVIMDTLVPYGVYDADVLRSGGTNADSLSDVLRDLPIQVEKETLRSTWNRESQILALKPRLIVIHRSAFFHALNVEFGFGYEPFAGTSDKARWDLLYRTADDKLAAFLGLAGTVDPGVKILVYSRGTGSNWPDAAYREQWIKALEQRFPVLQGRVNTVYIAGGVESGSFKNPKVIAEFRVQICAALGLSCG